ncbi:MAG: hypothetical protein B6I37_05365 [Desulfobacteraceae bacterium 4572_35.2]|nr:MAG: hypothetical protein B6I37_05365 [Desulfobacteraceae bacterium 4572_35.2]
MAFNSGKTYKDMLCVAQDVAQEHWSVLQAPFEQVMEQQRERMREISGDWIRTGISDKALDADLAELQQVFIIVFEKIPQLDQKLSQKATKAALNCFWEALMAGL